MITDLIALQEIRSAWNGVEALRERIQVGLFATVGTGSSVYPFHVADAAHNLPFLHAYSVLNDTLQQLASEGNFNCKSIFLGNLLQASEKVLPWNDFTVIKLGAARRNDLAHHGNVLPRSDCWRYIDAIKSELTSWGVLIVN
ncbi:MAG: hypothetical protein R3C14_18840 [Caldilineaceae bacterium]